MLERTFGTSGSIDDRISRAATLVDEDTSDGYAAYSYLGLGTVAVVEFDIPSILLSRFRAHNGTVTTGQYPGLDRYGRIARQLWVDSTYGPHDTDGTVPNRPPIVETAYTYDNASSRMGAFDARPGSGQRTSQMYSYDGLHRLIDARRGLWTGGLGSPSVSVLRGSQEWSLDPLGNWLEVGTAPAGGGIGVNDIETRDFRSPPVTGTNLVNELTQRELAFDAGDDTVGLTYDFAGNLLRQELTNDGAGEVTALRYVHDAWNRLVRVEHETLEPEELPVIEPVAEYEYNGLNWRTIANVDSTPDVGPQALDQRRLMYYDADWRLLEERIDLDFDPEEELEESTVDQHTQYVWGERYIDDIIATRHDLDPEEENGADLTYFHVTDAQFSTVAMVLPIPSMPARVLERVTYSAYGVARHHRIADLNGDGGVDGADLGLFPGTSLSIGDVGYRGDADFDRNGANDGGDLGFLLGDWGAPLPDGDLSAPATRNRIGFCGYVFAPQTRMYLARNRWLEPPLGRWVQRDPLGYVDGMNLYLYGFAAPVDYSDAFGLASACPPCLTICCTPNAEPPAWTPPPGKRGPIFQECQELYTGERQKCLKYAIGSPEMTECYRQAETVLRNCNVRLIGQGIVPAGGLGTIARGFGEGLCDGGLAFCKGVGKFAVNTIDCVVCGAIPDASIESYFDEIDQYMSDPSMPELVVSEACGQVYAGCAFSLAPAAIAARTGATMEVALCRVQGQRLPHITYGSGGHRIHAIGDLFKMDVCGLSPRLAHRLSPFARLTGIPVLRPAAVNATGGRAWTCLGAAVRAFGRGWGLP